VYLGTGSDKPHVVREAGPTWNQQFNILFRRNIQEALRNYDAYVCQVGAKDRWNGPFCKVRHWGGA
jgi:hypothetical protein